MGLMRWFRLTSLNLNLAACISAVILASSLASSLALTGVTAQAQDAPPQNAPRIEVEPSPDIPELRGLEAPDIQVPNIEIPIADLETQTPDGPNSDAADNISRPDYSQLTPQAERMAKLDHLFERLQAESEAEDANLIAEEIWAVWLDSGSASVDFIIRRATSAQKSGELDLARRLFDHVTALSPDYAEGWARSGRLAFENKDFGRALTETTQSLVQEPRHFYALWTLGNIFEQLGRQDEALETYREAHKLYPALKAVKERLDALQSDIDGDVL